MLFKAQLVWHKVVTCIKTEGYVKYKQSFIGITTFPFEEIFILQDTISKVYYTEIG